MMEGSVRGVRVGFGLGDDVTARYPSCPGPLIPERKIWGVAFTSAQRKG